MVRFSDKLLASHGLGARTERHLNSSALDFDVTITFLDVTTAKANALIRILTLWAKGLRQLKGTTMQPAGGHDDPAVCTS